MLHITFSKYDCIIVHKAYYLFTCTCVSINSFHSHSHSYLSLLSIITPKNCVDFTHCMNVFCIITSLPRVFIFYHVMRFLTLIINLFALSQIVILFNSSFSISTNLVYYLPSRKTLVSSAKRKVKNNVGALEKLFIKRIKKSRLKIDPCGTPYSMDSVLELQSL